MSYLTSISPIGGNQDDAALLRVGMFGIERRTEKLLARELMNAYSKQCSIVDVDDAQVVLFDINQESDVSMVTDYSRRHPEKKCLAMTEKGVRVNGLDVIVKPILLDVLMRGIRNAASRDNSVAGGVGESRKQAADVLDLRTRGKSGISRKENPSKDGGDHCWEYYDPDKYLVGDLVQLSGNVKKNSGYTRLRFSSSKVIIYDHGRRIILTDATDKQLKFAGALEKVMGNRVYHEEIGEQEVLELKTGSVLSEKSIEQTIWIAAMAASSGRLPQGDSPDQYIYLSRWPNLTRLMNLDDSMRISSLLAKGARSMESIVDDLGITVTSLCNYYACTSSIGLSGKATRSSDSVLASIPPKKHQERSLFRSLLGKLAQ